MAIKDLEPCCLNSDSSAEALELSDMPSYSNLKRSPLLETLVDQLLMESLSDLLSRELLLEWLV